MIRNSSRNFSDLAYRGLFPSHTKSTVGFWWGWALLLTDTQGHRLTEALLSRRSLITLAGEERVKSCTRAFTISAQKWYMSFLLIFSLFARTSQMAPSTVRELWISCISRKEEAVLVNTMSITQRRLSCKTPLLGGL